ncbi:MAG TPA: hypothetical protein VNZ57_12260 [Longimicrobiales bacterium]|nr:hypothetical protein [Longimicrobiales bacterium]
MDNHLLIHDTPLAPHPDGRAQPPHTISWLRVRVIAGTTLLELTAALAIVGVVIGLTLPALRDTLDTVAVRAARTAMASGIARTRAAAVARGGARFVVHPEESRFWIEGMGGDTLASPVDLAADYGVELSAGSGSQARLELRFDGLGIGRVASRTFTITRGSASARLTVSSYGRVGP